MHNFISNIPCSPEGHQDIAYNPIWQINKKIQKPVNDKLKSTLSDYLKRNYVFNDLLNIMS
jgi:hypothetical protein